MRHTAAAACCRRGGGLLRPPALESSTAVVLPPADGPDSKEQAAKGAVERRGTRPGAAGTSPFAAGGASAGESAEEGEASGRSGGAGTSTGGPGPGAVRGARDPGQPSKGLASKPAAGGLQRPRGGEAESPLPSPGPLRPSGSLRLLSDRVVQYEEEGSPGSLGASVTEVITFRGCEDLRRGTPLAKVLQGRGRIFCSSSGSAATYALSKPVTRIDAFLSHNWSVSRLRKFAALVVHFNLLPAMCMTLPVLMAVVAFSVAGLTPTYSVPESAYPLGMACRATAGPLFLLALFSAHRAMPEITVFLDKTCIDQENPDVQRRGIEKLGAFLRHSNTMVAVYSDVYLRRLWTVYELANFLALHPTTRMHVIPTVAPLVLILGVAVGYASQLLAMLLEMYCGLYRTQRFTLCGLSCLLVLAFRDWNRERNAMRSRLQGFSLSTCTCEKESDRPLVYGNIAALMRAARAVERHASDEEALAAFEAVVRDSLGQLLLASIGPYGLKLSHTLVVSFLVIAPTWLDTFAGVAQGMPARVVVMTSVRYLTLFVCIIPMVFAMWTACAAVCLHLRAFPELCFVCFVVLLGGGFGIGLLVIMDKLLSWSIKSTIGVCLLITFSALMAFSTALVFRSRPQK